MRSYYLPREYKGEGRILYIFSVKSLIATVIGGTAGLLIGSILGMFGLGKALVPLMLIFGGIGFVITAVKMPDSNNFEITRKTGGEKIDDVIKKWFAFKMKHGKIYLYVNKSEVVDTKEEKK